MSIKSIASIFIFLTLGIQGLAQNYGDSQFYICDTLDLDIIVPKEKSELDSILELYHSRDLANDTLGLYYIEQLVSGFESGRIEELYRFEYLRISKELLLRTKAKGAIKNRIHFAAGYANANIGIMFWKRSNQDSALYYFQSAIPHMAKTDSINYYALVINASASCYRNQGKLNEAISMNLEALKLVELSSDTLSMAVVYNNLAGLHQDLGNYDKAVHYFDLAIVCAIARNKPYQVGIAISNKAEMFFENYKDTLQAEKIALEAKTYVSDEAASSNYYLSKSVNEILGKIYLSQNRFLESKKCFTKGVEIAVILESDIDKSRNYNGLAQVELKEGNIYEAKELILSSIDLAEKNQLRDEGLVAYEIAAEIFKNLEDYKKALNYSEKASKIRVVLSDVDQKKAILKQNYEYDFNKKSALDSVENSKIIAVAAANENTAQVEAEKSRFQSWIAISVAILVAIFLWIIFNRLRVIRSQKKELNLAYDQLEETKKYELAASNLKAIKSQMNPHFIFNAVNSIQDLVLQKETIKSYDYLVLFSQMVRTILDFSEREFIPLEEEIDFLNKYLGLEKLRFDKDFEFKIIADNCPKGIFIPSLIIQPFAENAIKHGLLHKTGKKSLTISFEYEDKLTCTILDNGVGEKESKAIQTKQSSKHKSFSTQAIAQRLELLKERTSSEAHYSSNTVFNQDEIMGTIVKVVLPTKK